MDLSDIIPWIIIIGASLLGALGKSAKSKQGGATAQQNRGRQVPPVSPRALPPVYDAGWGAGDDMDMNDDWIPTNDNIPEPAQASVAVDDAWKNEGGRTTVDEPQQATAPVTQDPYAAEQGENDAVPQDWKRAIIAHEILKTKF